MWGNALTASDSALTGDRRIGWLFVAGQFALLAVIIFVPDRTGPESLTWDWSTTTTSVLTWVTWLSVAVMVVAALGLGRGLTPVPLPNEHAQLRTGGLYRFVRHPIYSGLLLFASAMAIKSGSVVVLGAAVALTVLISFKARWEERFLALRFPGYAEYADRTPRFVPGWPVRH